MKKISLMDVAEYVYISPAYLSKLFKEELKYNFNSYLNKVRVDMSKKMLKDYRISLINIALSCGFEDQSYYSKVFKRFTGISPGKYRESILK
jgi:YesN/AraC family two-component response regulator